MRKGKQIPAKFAQYAAARRAVLHAVRGNSLKREASPDVAQPFGVHAATLADPRAARKFRKPYLRASGVLPGRSSSPTDTMQ